MSVGYLLDIVWMSFGCPLGIFLDFFDIYWMSIGFLLDFFWMLFGCLLVDVV